MSPELRKKKIIFQLPSNSFPSKTIQNQSQPSFILLFLNRTSISPPFASPSSQILPPLPVYCSPMAALTSINGGRCEAGDVHVIIGPMFAGKTTDLLRRIKSERSSGRNVAMIKSSKDTRYANDSVVTHDGLKFPCWSMLDLTSFRQKLGDDEYHKLDVIGIDEAQFFEDLYEFCCKAADHDGKTIIVAGLDGDYLRRSFGSVLDVIPLAETVTKLSARCELCGKRAFFTLRKTEETRTELIGGSDLYMPVCRQHYVSGQAGLFESTRKNALESFKVPTDSHTEVAPVM